MDRVLGTSTELEINDMQVFPSSSVAKKEEEKRKVTETDRITKDKQIEHVFVISGTIQDEVR